MSAGDFAKLSLNKKAPTGTKIKGKSTIFSMSIEKGRTAYRYDVEIFRLGKQVDKELTKQSDLGLRTFQKSVCTKIIDFLHRSGKIKGNYVYDGKACLFSTESFPQVSNLVFPSAQAGDDVMNFCKEFDVKVSVTPNGRVPKLDYSDLKTCLYQGVDDQADHSVRQFLELVTSQYLLNTGNFHAIGAGTLFNRERHPLVAGMEIRVGVSKGVRVSEQKDGCKAFVVVDMRRSAFMSSSQTMDAVLSEFKRTNPRFGQQDFERHVRGIRCRALYRPNFTFTVRKLTRFPVGHKSLCIADQDNSTIPQYFTHRYKTSINPNLPGVEVDMPGRSAVVVPLDQCQALEGQLVPSEKINEQAVRKLVLENSVDPNVRYNFVVQQLREIVEGKGADFLKKFGIAIDVTSNDVDIYRRPILEIQAGGKKIKPNGNAAFMTDAVSMKLLQPTSLLKNWLVVFDKNSTNTKNVQDYVGLLLSHAKQSNMPLPPPAAIVPSGSDNELQQVFVNAAAKKIQMIFHIDDQRNKSHGLLKLYESFYKVLTQQVLTKNMQNKPQTLKNVILKTNVKAFGINYMPVYPASAQNFFLEKNADLLVIGYDVAHPPPATGAQRKPPRDGSANPYADNELKSTHPSVVGICANKGKNPRVFGGDFFFHPSRRENVNVDNLAEAAEAIFASAKKAERTITRVLVIRDGLSEGQFEYAAREELPAIKKGFRAVYAGSEAEAKFTFVVATKQHNKRFYEVANNGVRNTCVGDVVADKVTRSDVNEFYLQSHHPLKGVPKMTQYSELVNELNMSNEELHAVMHSMSCMHQVSACPTSLPLPVYMADELAKRGADIFRAFMMLPQENPIKTGIGYKQGLLDFEAVTARLSYRTHPLGGTRFNA